MSSAASNYETFSYNTLSGAPTPLEVFLKKVTGKKIRWSSWDSNQWFIPDGTTKSYLLPNYDHTRTKINGRIQDGKISSYFYANGFDQCHQEESKGEWEFYNEKSAGIESPMVSALKELYPITPQFKPAVLPIYPLKKRGPMKLLKDYFEKHQDLIFTVSLVVLADHFLFGGAFRERLKRLVEGLLNNTEQKLLGKSGK